MLGEVLGDDISEETLEPPDDVVDRFIVVDTSLFALSDIPLEHVLVEAQTTSTEVLREHFALDLHAHFVTDLRHVARELEQMRAVEGRVREVDNELGEVRAHDGLVDPERGAGLEARLDVRGVEGDLLLLEHLAEEDPVDLVDAIAVHGGLLKRAFGAPRYLRARVTESSVTSI